MFICRSYSTPFLCVSSLLLIISLRPLAVAQGCGVALDHTEISGCSVNVFYINTCSAGGPYLAATYKGIQCSPEAGSTEVQLGPVCKVDKSAECGAPVNLATGNVYIQHLDMPQLPGLGAGIELSRIWNSVWPATQEGQNTGMFGINWRSSYEERVYLGSDGYYKYLHNTGSIWSFAYDTSLHVLRPISPADEYATLSTVNLNGTSYWAVSLLDGSAKYFSKISGSLMYIVDRHGNTSSLTYDSSNRLTKVTDPAGRTLSFTYVSSSIAQVSKVTASTGRVASYAYDSQKRLTTVTEPDGSTLNYAYADATSYLISSVTDAQGKVLEAHTYDSIGRGLTSVRANGADAITVTYPQ